MSDCNRFESILESYVAGEVDETRLGPLLGHCRDCEACRRLVELHRDLLTLAGRVSEPEEGDFDRLQARVLQRTARPAKLPEIRAEPRVRWRAPGLHALRAAAAILIFVTGLWAGRLLTGQGSPDENGGMTNRLVRAISAEAASNRELADVEDSRFTYSNVSFRRMGGDRVALDFDVATHVQLVEPIESELVREVMVQSLLNESSTGARLKAISYAANRMEPKVIEALIFALKRDESLAVRLKALTLLSEQLRDPAVEAAVLATLRDDESVQVRLLALECLAAHRVDRDRIRELIHEREQPGDEALMVRLAEYERPL